MFSLHQLSSIVYVEIVANTIKYCYWVIPFLIFCLSLTLYLCLSVCLFLLVSVLPSLPPSSPPLSFFPSLSLFLPLLLYFLQIWKDVFSQSDPYTPYLKYKLPGKLHQLQFCPFEDCLGLGHSDGFTSIVVPGTCDIHLKVCYLWYTCAMLTIYMYL